jgi:hypothetical protein
VQNRIRLTGPKANFRRIGRTEEGKKGKNRKRGEESEERKTVEDLEERKNRKRNRWWKRGRIGKR